MRFYRIQRLILSIAVFFAVADGFVFGQEKPPVIRQESIDDMTAFLIRYIAGFQQENGSFSLAFYPVGTTAICLYALRTAEIPETDAVIRAGTAYLRRTRSSNTYEEGLVLCALTLCDLKENKDRIEFAIEFLIQAQKKNGGWRYGIDQSTVSDESCSQYAVLGLASAVDAGFTVPKNVLNGALSYFKWAQNNDGGWGYCHSGSTFSMTAAGTASLRLLGLRSYTPIPGVCGEYRTEKPLLAGLNWLSPKVAGFLDSMQASSYGYYAGYGLERVAILNEIKAFNGVDWYARGIRNILQFRDWSKKPYDAAFALLFLARNAAPIAISKVVWDGTWNSDRYDVIHWTKLAQKQFQTPLDYQYASLESEPEKAARASLVFLTGHGKLKMSDTGWENLRRLQREGVVIVVEPCCGDREFFDSFRVQAEKMLDSSSTMKFRRIPDTHPVYHAPFELSPKKVPIYTMKKGCGSSEIYLLQNDISCALNGDVVAKDQVELAQKTSLNLLAYALRIRKARKKYENVQLPTGEELSLQLESFAARQGEGAVHAYENPVGRIRFGGEWNTDPKSIPAFSKSFEKNPDMIQFDAHIPVDPETNDVFACQLLLLSGHNEPLLSKNAVLNLRQYLRNGGRLLVEACCADEKFDQGVRKLFLSLCPGRPLLRIPFDASVYRVPFDLLKEQPEYTKAALADIKSQKRNADEWPEVYGIAGIDGKWEVLYLPLDITCALDGDLDESISGMRFRSAVRLLANLVTNLLAPDPPASPPPSGPAVQGDRSK